MKSAQASQSRGFTLIELLITIAVLTILIVLATPSFFDAIDRRRVVDATEAIGKQVQQARMAAIETSRPITMVFDAASDPWCFGLTYLGDCECNTANSCQIPFDIPFDSGFDPADVTGWELEEVVGRGSQFPGITITAPSANLRFEPRRGLRDLPATPFESIVVTSERGSQAEVMINIIGRVSTCSDNIPGMKPCP